MKASVKAFITTPEPERRREAPTIFGLGGLDSLKSLCYGLSNFETSEPPQAGLFSSNSVWRSLVARAVWNGEVGGLNPSALTKVHRCYDSMSRCLRDGAGLTPA